MFVAAVNFQGHLLEPKEEAFPPCDNRSHADAWLVQKCKRVSSNPKKIAQQQFKIGIS